MKKRLTLDIKQELTKNILKTKTDALVLGINEGKVLNSSAAKVDGATNGIIKKLVKRGDRKSVV